MLEQDQLVQLLPNPFPSEFLTIFFTKMVKSDLAVTFSNKFDQPKYVFIIHCCFNHVVIKFPENSCPICFSQHRGCNCIWKSFTYNLEKIMNLSKMMCLSLQTHKCRLIKATVCKGQSNKNQCMSYIRNNRSKLMNILRRVRVETFLLEVSLVTKMLLPGYV